MERDFRRILAAEVEVNFKVAMILCNQLGWRVEFDFYRDQKYTLFIPLHNDPHNALEDLLAAA